jgi:signal transduction histidine kinase
VASGLGDHFHIDPTLVRLAFVVLTLAGGAGVVLYAGGWLFLPTETESTQPGERARNDIVQVIALGAITLGVLLLARSIGLGFSDALLWPVVLAAMGTALIVGRSGRPIDELIGELVQHERGVTERGTASDTSSVLRVVLGGALVVAGVGAFLATQGAFRAVGQGLLAVAVILGGLGLIFGPWLWRLWNALVEERSERIRSDERAEMAAHLHDSVLQTLALIQRRADDPRAVVGLARHQERELRAWLFGRAPADVDTDLDLGDALDAVAADVEARQGIPIETVRVGGSCALDDGLRALVAASQEAIINAVRHSGAPTVAVYEEVEPDQVTVFVRDRGRGFDPTLVPTDRGGIAESITGRMQRNGGRAVIRSRPGHGTEVELTMVRSSVTTPA